MTDLSRFQDNFTRLLGLHAMTQNSTAELLGVSAATMSSWIKGHSTPSLRKAIAIAEFFGVSTDRLMGATFTDLLANELADPQRFAEAEARIKHGRRKASSRRALKAVD